MFLELVVMVREAEGRQVWHPVLLQEHPMGHK